jgi:Glycolipid 2-alpha-mannosyltransferase
MFRPNYSARSPIRSSEYYDYIPSYIRRNRISTCLSFIIIIGFAYLIIFSLVDGESSTAADDELFSEDIYRHAMIDFVQDERVKAHLDVPELHADIRIDWTAVNNTLPVKAALVAVVRNADLYTIRSTIRTIEDRWNHQYNYPWVFLSDQPLSQEFKHYTQMLSGAPMYYGLIDQSEWSYPHWIDTRFAEMEMARYAEMGLFRGGSLDFRLKSRQVIKERRQ